MASAKIEGSSFSDRKLDAPLADTAAGESGVSATSAVSPAAIPTGKLKEAIQRLNALTERMNDKPRV